MLTRKDILQRIEGALPEGSKGFGVLSFGTMEGPDVLLITWYLARTTYIVEFSLAGVPVDQEEKVILRKIDMAEREMAALWSKHKKDRRYDT